MDGCAAETKLDRVISLLETCLDTGCDPTTIGLALVRILDINTAQTSRTSSRVPAPDHGRALSDMVHVRQAPTQAVPTPGPTPPAARVPAPHPTTERQFTQSRGPKVQQYSPDGKDLIRTFSGYADVRSAEDLDSPSPAATKEAIGAKTVYKGWRWAALIRGLPDDTVQDIGETVPGKVVRQGLVAMLSMDQSRVVRVFCDMKAAAEDRHFSGPAAISSAVKNNTQSGGHYFRMWFDLEEDLQAEYMRSGGALPAPRVLARNRPVEKLDYATGEVLGSFSSLSDAISAVKISRASLMKAIEKHTVAKGFRWRYKAV